MDVDDLGNWPAVDDSVRPQTEKGKVMVDIRDFPQLSVHVLDIFEDKMDLHPKNGRAFIGWMALEPGKRRQQHNDSKLLLALVRLDDLVAQALRDPVLLRNEKLIFNIDVFLRIADKFDIGIHYRMLRFGLFQSNCPH